mmetsp:Transcript_35922/g.78705  ORF Transcript_35922/g.78705 Transcript_35922/m.78705 type:complete len:418 (+) Transcript_35922:126-1379(+)
MFVRLVIFAAALLVGTVNGFVPQTSVHQVSRSLPTSTTSLHDVDPTGFDAAVPVAPYGEQQRLFRRTVYTHDDWKKHRSQDRFFNYLARAFKSGVYKNMDREVSIATIVASVVVVYNLFATGYTGLDGVQHGAIIDGLPKLSLPLNAFTVTSPSLGLLLVFRTNTSYKRWDEARKNWGMNINHTRDLVRMANAFYDDRGVSSEQRAEDLKHVALCTWAFVRAMKRHLSPAEEDEAEFQAEMYAKLGTEQAQKIIAAAHRPNSALQDLSYAIDGLPMHFLRKNEIHTAVTIFEDNLGSSERLLTSPVPLVYSRHLARFLGIWLLLLPLGLYDSFSSSWNHIALVPATFVTSTMLFGIEEIGTQLEEPFTVLPMQAFCDKIYNWCTEIVSWTPGDNGRERKPVKPEHMYFSKKEMKEYA